MYVYIYNTSELTIIGKLFERNMFCDNIVQNYGHTSNVNRTKLAVYFDEKCWFISKQKNDKKKNSTNSF